MLFTRYTPIAPLLSFYFLFRSYNKIIPLFLFIITIVTAVAFPLYAFKGIDANDPHTLGVVERFGQLGFLLLGITSVVGLHALVITIKTHHYL